MPWYIQTPSGHFFSPARTACGRPRYQLIIRDSHNHHFRYKKVIFRLSTLRFQKSVMWCHVWKLNSVAIFYFSTEVFISSNYKSICRDIYRHLLVTSFHPLGRPAAALATTQAYQINNRVCWCIVYVNKYLEIFLQSQLEFSLN